MRRTLGLLLTASTALTMTTLAVAQEGQPAASVATPAAWPKAKSSGLVDAATEKRIDDILAKLSIEEKVGQMIQADIGSIKPEDLRSYPLGSILAGGNTPPIGSTERGPASDWLKTTQAFRAVAAEARPGHVPIPLIFGVDSVHGNNNAVGATLFPHNIGLGAANDPALIRKIGAATAIETAVAGPDWAFAPALSVPRDDRWGRTYEGYSEDPAIVVRYAGAMVEGLQGAAGKGRIQQGRVAATIKHFLGDGGTENGIDQGDTRVSEADLIATHGVGYVPGINAGAMTVMASFSSWNGWKMHGNPSLLSDVLKGRLGFDGFIVGDWEGHGQIPGCTNTNCPQTFLAGLDMAMAPNSWKGLYTSTLAQARDGTIPMARIDDAVRRILRVKLKLGLFDSPRPMEGRLELLGAPAHRAVAREAVRKSLVLLKNQGVLPIRSSANILVAGPAADDIGLQSGGWTLTWQGEGNQNSDFPGATSIYAGIAQAAKASGGSATLSADGSFTTRPDVAIVVFGEAPYAEGVGDLRMLDYADEAGLRLLRKFKAAGVPTVSVFLSGRPLWVNPELNASDAFVAAWLPGSEGAGVADVLLGDAAGKPRHDFAGRLSFSWPKTGMQFALNKGAPGYDPLFALGYGLSYARPGTVAMLSEESGVDPALLNLGTYFDRGVTPAPWSFATDSRIERRRVDSATVQEGAVSLTWPEGPATLRIGGSEIDITQEMQRNQSLQFVYRLDRAATGPVKLRMEGGANSGKANIDATSLFQGETGTWRTGKIILRCYQGNGIDLSKVVAPFVVEASGPLAFTLAEVKLVSDFVGTGCPGTPPRQ